VSRRVKVIGHLKGRQLGDTDLVESLGAGVI